MKRLSILLVALLAVVVCTNLPAAGNPGNGNKGGNVGNGGNQNAGVLDPTEEDDLVFIREEEKLARDVYIALYDVWHQDIFLNIAESEQRHMDTMLKMLDLYGDTDPVGSNGEGVFTNPALGPLYLDLVEKGSLSPLDAYQVGVIIEEMDIESIQRAIDYTDEFRLDKSYGNLMAGSYNHLAAFIRQLNRLGIDYESEYLDIEDFETDLGATRKHRGKR